MVTKLERPEGEQQFWGFKTECWMWVQFKQMRKWGSQRGEASSLNVPTNGANLISASASGLLWFSKKECGDGYRHHTTFLQGASRNNGDLNFWLLSWQLSLGKIDWVSRRGQFSSDVSVTTTWGQVCSPTPSSQKYFATPQKNRCRTKPITCIWPLLFLCRDESGNTVWLCQPLGFQRESEGQVPSTLKFPSQLGGVAGDWRKGRIPSRKPSPTQISTVSN